MSSTTSCRPRQCPRQTSTDAASISPIKGPVAMADPAPSAPLPDVAPERRVSPADQMAALTGEPVELSQPEADEPAEDHNDASSARQIGARAAMAPFERTAPAVAVPSNDPTNHAPATTSDSAETPVSPPAPREPVSSAEPPRAPDATP